MNKSSFYFLLTLFCFFSHLPFHSQTTSFRDRIGEELETRAERLAEFPAWLLVEKGKELRTQGRIADAFTYFLIAQDKTPQDPAIEVEIAKAYLQTGDMFLAQFHLEKALEKRLGFPNPEMVYDVYYLRSDLAWLEERFRDYELELMKIIENDPLFMNSDEFNRNLRSSYLSSILDRGLDRSLVLYRIPDSFSLEAHRRLGIFYVQTGRFQEALPHLIFATFKSFTRVINEYRSRTIDFQFTSLPILFDVIQDQPGLLDYLSSVAIYETLYYLGEAIWGYDQTKLNSAREIWIFLANYPNSGAFSGASSAQLDNPTVYMQLKDRL